MKCPKCNSTHSRVVDSRHADEANAIRRRRECENCGTRFTTFEHIEVSPLIVVKKDGTREQFLRKNIKWFSKILRETTSALSTT